MEFPENAFENPKKAIENLSEEEILDLLAQAPVLPNLSSILNENRENDQKISSICFQIFSHPLVYPNYASSILGGLPDDIISKVLRSRIPVNDTKYKLFIKHK